MDAFFVGTPPSDFPGLEGVPHVNRYAFIPERLAGVSIFKLPQFPKN